jgi:hypothetical protein
MMVYADEQQRSSLLGIGDWGLGIGHWVSEIEKNVFVISCTLCPLPIAHFPAIIAGFSLAIALLGTQDL